MWPCSAFSTSKLMNMVTMVSPNAKAVVSNASANPSVTEDIDFSSNSGVTPAMAPVIPRTVPRNPKMGTAQVMNRVRP